MPAKQIIFLALLAAGIPCLGGLLYAVPTLRRLRLALLVFAPAWIIDVNLFFIPYRGTSSGLELGTPEATKIWLTELEKFFFGDGSQLPDEYVPPEQQ